MSNLPPKKRKNNSLFDKIDIIGISQLHKMARNKGGPAMYQGADSDGTPIDLDKLIQSIGGFSKESMESALFPVFIAPTLESSILRISYELLAKIIFVMFKFSLA